MPWGALKGLELVTAILTSNWPLRITSLVVGGRWLTPVLQGEARGAFGFTEPTNGSGSRSVAVKSADGSELVVTGVKSYVTGGASADFVAVMCGLRESDGVTKAGSALVVCPTAAAGVSCHRVFRTLDPDMPGHAYMRFDKVRVPSWSVVGAAGGKGGLTAAFRTIGEVRLRLAATAVGTARWALAHTAELLNRPRRSGGPLAEREGPQLRFATMVTETSAARAMLFQTARMLDHGDPNGDTELMATKLISTEVAGRVVDGCVQLAGGTSIVVGDPLEAAYRRVRQWRFAEGASDLLRIKIAKAVLSGAARL